MSEDGNWVASIDISVIAYIYNINIAFYLFDEINNNLNYAHLFSYDENNEQIPLLILKNANFNNFEVLINAEDYVEIINENTGKVDFSEENDDIIQNIGNNNKISLTSKECNEISKHNENLNIEVNSKSSLTQIKYLYDPKTPYTKYILGNDENLYINIYNYLEKGLIKNKRVWPKYIEDIKDKRLKDQKKTDFCRKMEIYKSKPKKNRR